MVIIWDISWGTASKAVVHPCMFRAYRSLSTLPSSRAPPKKKAMVPSGLALADMEWRGVGMLPAPLYVVRGLRAGVKEVRLVRRMMPRAGDCVDMGMPGVRPPTTRMQGFPPESQAERKTAEASSRG